MGIEQTFERRINHTTHCFPKKVHGQDNFPTKTRTVGCVLPGMPRTTSAEPTR